MGNNGNRLEPVGKHEEFSFSCGPEVPCFNECCRDLNQFLTPYDVVRLAGHLAVECREFVRQWTRIHTGPETGLPVVSLRPSEEGRTCPFVTRQGCSVYEDRPSSCRMYPLARVLGKDRRDQEVGASYFIIREQHCLGFGRGRPMTPQQWMEDQGLGPYNELNDTMLEVISIKRRHLPGPLAGRTRDRLFFALYLTDSFGRDLSGQTGRECRNFGLCPDNALKGGSRELVKLATSYCAALLRSEAGITA